MHSELQDHWTRVYQHKAPSDVSWYQPHPGPSLEALDRFGAGPSNSLIDIGGGASTLVDELLRRGWADVTVLDIAAPALGAAKERLDVTLRRFNGRLPISRIGTPRDDMTCGMTERCFISLLKQVTGPRIAVLF